MDITHFEAVVTGIGATLALITVVIAYSRKVVKRISNFLDDWNGEPSRPGYDRKPGVMERMQMIDTRLYRVEAQFHPNGGGSLTDKVNKISSHLEAQDVTTESNRTKDGLNESH